MGDNICANCLLYSYVSYVSCFFCMAIRDIVKEAHKKWKKYNVNMKGFNTYEIIPKMEEPIVSTININESMENDIIPEEETRTINLNESTSSILKKWTIRPNI